LEVIQELKTKKCGAWDQICDQWKWHGLYCLWLLEGALQKTCDPCAALYCATTGLDGYPSDLDKIHYILMVTSFYICCTTFYEPWQIITPVLITPPIHLLLLSDICFHPSWATCKPHHQLIRNSLIYHICMSKGPGLTLKFQSIWRQGVECGGKQDNGDSKWRQSATWRQ